MELSLRLSARQPRSRVLEDRWKLLNTQPDSDPLEEDERGECPACGEKKLKPLPAHDVAELVAVCLSCGLLVQP